MAAEKLDLQKLYKDEYIAPKEPTFVRSIKARFLTSAGKGDPGGPVFLSKVRALYDVAVRIQRAKKAEGQEFDVLRVETQWWPDEGGDLCATARDQLHWKLLIRLPQFVAEGDRLLVILDMIERNKDPVLLNEVWIEALREGLCLQVLHTGPLDKVPETIARLKGFADQKKLTIQGTCHEIYLSDMLHAAPAEWRTIVRIPVK